MRVNYEDEKSLAGSWDNVWWGLGSIITHQLITSHQVLSVIGPVFLADAKGPCPPCGLVAHLMHLSTIKKTLAITSR